MSTGREISGGEHISKAVVIAPAEEGSGGQGAAAGAMALGLTSLGIDVSYVGNSSPSLARRLAGKRPLRRLGRLARELDRSAIRRRLPAGWQLAYAMPGYLPSEKRGIRALHQATDHPRMVMTRLEAARRVAGGGRGFMTKPEMHRLERELVDADIVRVESS